MTVPAFGAKLLFADYTGWSRVGTPSVTKTKQRAQATGQYGDEEASTLYGEVYRAQQEYEAKANSPVLPTYIGDVEGSYLLESIVIRTGAQYARMTLSGHNHPTNAHATGAVRRVAHGITLTKAFGVTDFCGGTAGSSAKVLTSSITISVEHVDDPDGDGEQWAGDNYRPMITAESEWSGEPSTPSNGTWDRVEVAPRYNAEGYLRYTVRCTKAIAGMPAPAVVP